MNIKYKKMIVQLLKKASEEFGDKGCNDTPDEILNILSQEEKEELNDNMHTWEDAPGDHDKDNLDIIYDDWILTDFLGDLLAKEIEQEELK